DDRPAEGHVAGVDHRLRRPHQGRPDRQQPGDQALRAVPLHRGGLLGPDVLDVARRPPPAATGLTRSGPARYRAVVFDLLTALLDSWTLWGAVAGSDDAGLRWRRRYLELTYGAGPYRSYEGIIAEAGREAGVPGGRAEELIRRWSELAPWPETREIVQAVLARVPVARATNPSLALARIARRRGRPAIPGAPPPPD